MFNYLKLLIICIATLEPSATASEGTVQTRSSSPIKISAIPFLPELSGSQAIRTDGLPKINLQRRIPLEQKIHVAANNVKNSIEQLLDTGTTEIDYNASFTLELLVTEIERSEFGNASFYLNEVKEMVLKGACSYQSEQSDIEASRNLIQNINLLMAMINHKIELLSLY